MEDRRLWRQKRSNDREENRQRLVSVRVRVSEHLVEPQGAKTGVMLVLYGVYMIWRVGRVLFGSADG